MKFTNSWLGEHVEHTLDVDALTERLSLAGLEVDELEDRAAGLSDLVVGHIIAAERHPNADKLQVCTVDIGGAETLQAG